MQKIIEKAQQDTTTMWLLLITGTLSGLLLGVICSPVKNGISIGNNNTIIGDGSDRDECGDKKDKREKSGCKRRRREESNIIKF